MELVERVDLTEAYGRHVLAAVSGGADSVALLHLLAKERPHLHLSAAHVEHGLRGEDSLRDAEFCRALCRRLDVPFHLIHVDVRGLRESEGLGLESAARKLRYEALERLRKETGADLIALAHHQDDQVETVLMHLLRGCGLEGARGMRRLQGKLYRPLLNIRKAELENWLTARGETWRTDATNATPDNPRNQLRLKGLPALKEIYPGADNALIRFAENAACDDDLLDELTNDFLLARVRPFAAGHILLLTPPVHEALLRRALRALLPSLGHEQIVALARLAPGRRSIPGWGLAERSEDALYLIRDGWRPPEPVPLKLCGATALAGIGRIEAAPHPAVPVRNDLLRQVLRRDTLTGAVVRTRRKGDRMRPLGAGDRLLSDVFTDKKIPRPLRDSIPLIARGDRILWAVGVCISEEAKLQSPNEAAVCLTFVEKDI